MGVREESPKGRVTRERIKEGVMILLYKSKSLIEILLPRIEFGGGRDGYYSRHL